MKWLSHYQREFVGRTLAEDLIDKDNKIIAKAGDIVSEENLSLIDKVGFEEIKVRSVLTCEAEFMESAPNVMEGTLQEEPQLMLEKQWES